MADGEMTSDAIKRRLLGLEAESFLTMDADRYFHSPYFADALRNGGPGVVRATRSSEYFGRLDALSDGRTFLDRHLAAIEEVPNSNGQRWNAKPDAVIGIIADDFLYASLASAGNFVRVTPSNYDMAADACDFLLVTSVWRGMAGEWEFVGSSKSANSVLLRDKVIPAFRSRDKQVVFYSKEDPPHYNDYLHVAQASDHIFTSAVEKVPSYERDCPQAQSIGVLQFSVSADQHNPVGSRLYRIPEVLFAGSWFNHKYLTRRTQALRIFDGVMNSRRDLEIVDRFSGERKLKYAFPEYLFPSMNKSINHDLLLRLQKHVDLNINLNSVFNSESMFANRVIELQGMGSAIISSYNVGVNSQFPNVYIPTTSLDARDWIDALSSQELFDIQMQGIRNAYSTNTNHDRIATILTAIGKAPSTQQRNVAVISENAKQGQLFVENQVLQDPDVSMIVVSNLAEAKKQGAMASLELNSELDYGRHFVQDTVNAFKYVDVDTIQAPVDYDGPWSNDVEHNYTESTPQEGASLRWIGPQPGKTENGKKRSYVIQRGQASRQGAINLTESTAQVAPELSVIVPVYNNGQHLLHKCFASLRRSSVFDRIEIILVDDGSSDKETLRILEDLDTKFGNVRVYLNPTGGSGSASRPRNQGLEMATAPYVGYLDPDNEAMNDAFAELLELVKSTGTNFAIGNMLMIDSKERVVPNTTVLKKVLERVDGAGGVWNVPSDALANSKFAALSIQALVANTAWLKSLGLEQPVGAVGQDTYFFQQMLHYSETVALWDKPVHVYFAAVANSTVNTIGVNFYRKYLPLEAARSTWLKAEGLLDVYNVQRLEPFMKVWYLDKFSKVAEDEKAQAFGVIKEILAMYEKTEWQDAKLAAEIDRLEAAYGDLNEASKESISS
ncbi:glycosyltransferase family 2 protein [Haematomicrobium sanguinis]|uniref:glycosyltransferase family 2 protein n=1 Tax=Haematomicrobium sanguinis TaxID=479106 RepID=UPI00047EAF05|nr:glycosyltransferase family 2 protein [Haematomicrobium sanguinis]